MTSQRGFSNSFMRKVGPVGVASFLASLTAFPVLAQQCNTTEFALPAIVHDGVRYTTSVTETAGWERNLVQRDPNLARWNWAPQHNYHQWMPKHTSKQAVAAEIPQEVLRRNFRYLKPIRAVPPTSLTAQINKPITQCHTHVKGQLNQILSYASVADGGTLYGVPVSKPTTASATVSGKIYPR